MHLKLIDLNMWLGGRLWEEIKPFIADEQADILALQEVHHAEDYPPEHDWHVISKLAEILGYTFYAFAPSFAGEWMAKGRVQYGNAILSRYPILSSESVFYDVPYSGLYQKTEGQYQHVPRNLQHAELDLGGKNLHVFNTQGIWDVDGADNPRRLAMGEMIAHAVAGKQPALLTGDFNVQEGTQTIAKIEAHMTNVFKGELKSSFNLRHKTNPGFATAIVDMMFASPDIKIGRHYASDTNVSDHLALVGEFEIQ